MASVADEFESVFLTYRDVKESNPSWSDRMVEDYLALKRDLLRLAGSGGSVGDLEARVEALEDLVPVKFLATSSRLVQSGQNEIILCNNVSAITVSLPAFPVDRQLVTVKRLNGAVTIAGGTKPIDGMQNISLARKYTSLSLVYDAVLSSWSIF